MNPVIIGLVRKKGLTLPKLWDLVGIQESNPSQAINGDKKGKRRPKPYTQSVVAQFARVLEQPWERIAIKAPRVFRPTKFQPRVAAIGSVSSEEIAAIYSNAAAGTEVWVFSGDGYIEASDEDFFGLIAPPVEDGRVGIRYFFPHGSVGNRSRHEFLEIRRKFVNGLGDAALDRIKGHFIEDRGSDLYAQGSRFIVVHDPGKPRDPKVFMWLNASGDNFWRPVDPRIVERMVGAIDPVEFVDEFTIGNRLWRLPKTVKVRYRQSFTNKEETLRYGDVRAIADTGKSLTKLIDLIVDAASKSLRTDDRHRLPWRWLDIGAEDGQTTEALGKKLRDAGFSFTLTAIETSPQSSGSLSPLLRHSAFLNDEDYKFENFAGIIPEDWRFDLITSIHSWYLIDPHQLVRAYRLLSNHGIFALLVAPFEDNVINWIVHEIDKSIVSAKHSPKRSAMNKEVASDALRNYGEDILKACKLLFGDTDGIEAATIRKAARSEDLVSKRQQLKADAFKIIEAFTHGLIAPEEINHSEIAASLHLRAGKGVFPANETALVINKARVVSNLRARFFSIAR